VTDIAATESRERNAHVWARDPHDYYREPDWCSERLFQVETFEGRVCDPAAGSGAIVRAAKAAGLTAYGCDIVDRGFDYYQITDFLKSGARTENIVSNPPFGCSQEFVARALRLSARKVAMLLPTTWLNGAARSRWLETTPLRRIWILAPRPSMPPGRLVDAGGKPGNGTKDFMWAVWLRGYDGRPEIQWLRRDAQP
jgi:hypothetical protein